jgi:hypothetical protein
MNRQPDFYSLEFFNNADFWARGDGTARRTLFMPLSNPFEFLAFGVLAPSNEVLFVARGEVASHLGDFIARMVQEGASVEFYARPPLPDDVLAPYIKDDPHDQKEAEPPPPVPKAVGEVSLRTEPTPLPLSSASTLWVTQGSTRKVLMTALPGSSEALAFGLVEVNLPEYRWGVPFVVRLGIDRQDFTTRMNTDGVSIVETARADLPLQLREYMNTHFPETLVFAAPLQSASSARGYTLAA